MNIKPIIEVKVHDEKDLRARIKTVKLRNSNIMPYIDSPVNLERFYRDAELNSEYPAPAQLYVLNSQLAIINELDCFLDEKYHIDLLDLSGWLEIKYFDNTWSALLPPIVEFTGAQYYICDGMHRVMYARMLNKPVRCAVVKNPDVRYYAMPVSWDCVQRIDVLQENTVKKFYTSTEPKKLYRDFNTAFPYVGESRQPSNS